MKQAYIYARISADFLRDEHGVSSQITQCTEYATQKGWTIAGEYIDNDVSAYSGATRPHFEQLLQDMQAGRVPRLIAWHPDKIARGVEDLGRVIDAAKKGGTEIHTVRAGDIDLTNTSGELMAHMLGAFTQLESAHLSEQQVASHADRATRGLWRGGRIPFGYESDGPGTLRINEHDAAIIRQWLTDLMGGDSLIRIVTRTKNKLPAGHRLKNMTVSELRRRLTNPTLAGLLQAHGEIVGRGNWEPILTEEEYHAACAMLDDPRRKTGQGQERRWQGSGIYRCGKCGGVVSVRNSRGHRYYFCRAGECVTIQQAPVDEIVNELIFRYLSTPGNRLTLTSQDDELEEETTRLEGERRQLITRKDDLGRLFAGGEIDAAQLSSGSKEIQRRITTLERRLDGLRKDSPVIDAVLDGDGLREVWEVKAPDKRAMIIRTLMDVTILPAPKGKRVPADERVEVRWKQ